MDVRDRPCVIRLFLVVRDQTDDSEIQRWVADAEWSQLQSVASKRD